MFDLSNRVAVITGGSSGIGVQFAHALAKQGADIAILARRYDRLVKNAEEISELYGVKCIPYKCDISNSENVKATAQAIEEAFGKADILVNCAGGGSPHWAVDMPDESWDAMMRLNLNGTFYCSREFGKIMLKNKHGRIINIASMLGKVGMDTSFGTGISDYATVKSGLMGMSRQLASEWAKHGVTVNTLCPGFFESEQSPVGNEAFDNYLEQWCPMSRPGKEHELDAAIVFMASDESSYMTGTEITVDGGWTAV